MESWLMFCSPQNISGAFSITTEVDGDFFLMQQKIRKKRKEKKRKEKKRKEKKRKKYKAAPI